MRTCRRVKQSMFYSLPKNGEPIYATDSAGNIIYDTMPDGETVARLVGETAEKYADPVPFQNSITGNLTEDEIQAFGNEPRMKAKMTYQKGEFPFIVGTKIWLHNEIICEPMPLYPSDDLFPNDYLLPNGKPLTDNAEYIIKGIQDTGRHFYKALLVSLVNDNESENH